MGSSLEKIAEEYGRQYKRDHNDQLEGALEPVGEGVEHHLVNGVGDDLKKISASADTSGFSALAMKRAKSAAASKQKKPNGFYYGMASGVMGVFAATALYTACKSNKKIQANEEAFL